MLSQDDAFAQQLREAEAYLQLRADEEDSLDKVLQAVQRAVQVHRAASASAMHCFYILNMLLSSAAARFFQLSIIKPCRQCGFQPQSCVQCTISAQVKCMPNISCDAGERGR